MDADAYLRKQGWRGSGHSLDSTDRGIKKPLLIAHKQDQLGLGKKKAAYTTDDQWWMRAYDQSLQSIGTGKESTLNQIRTQGINRGGLYGFFVKGEAIAGTIDDSSATEASPPTSGTSTPPTSASENEVTASNMSTKKSKRKRSNTEAVSDLKKAKKDRKSKEGKKNALLHAASATTADNEDRVAVASKLEKLNLAEKAEYATRAAAKGQTLEQYVLRRIQKKDEKRKAKYVNPSSNLSYSADVEGDIGLLNLHHILAMIPAPRYMMCNARLDQRCPMMRYQWSMDCKYGRVQHDLEQVQIEACQGGADYHRKSEMKERQMRPVSCFKPLNAA